MLLTYRSPIWALPSNFQLFLGMPHSPMVPEPFVSPVVLDEAIRILKTDEYRAWTPFESKGLTEEALHRLIQAWMFEGRMSAQVVIFDTGMPRYTFRIKVTGGWQRLEVVMQAVFDLNRVAPELIDRRHYQQSKFEVRTENYHEVRFRHSGEDAARDCQSESGEASIRQTIVEASNNSLRGKVHIDQWIDLEERQSPAPQAIAAAQAIASPEINVNIAVPPSPPARPHQPNQKLEQPGEIYHEDLMQCVQRNLNASPRVTWREMPSAVAREGFFPHSKTTLNDWYKIWKTNRQSV
ncbi:hypothetical protein FYK55_16990 [Roseiconus nitratireducens]|uniref:Uncharacterized protein n=1 Tax=Roseiconus nitratireducens TaxID=2605748 RepID=A0A5M6D6M2_9BACT|nr:hypothetical protein [Roseiconus nitratireducens]KAA5541892.1 hypothetical protein FYK55_16990 [Roseiconus nitratireducens]